jgi:hypothetical protein
VLCGAAFLLGETGGTTMEEGRKQEAQGRKQKSKSGRDAVAEVTKECEGCSRWKEVRKKIRVAELLATAIDKLKGRFQADDFKPSVADYLKLVELEEELAQSSETVKEIKVTWVESKESYSGK